MGLERSPRAGLTLNKRVVGTTPGAAVFSGLQFQEYNEGEVNTKNTHKKKEKRDISLSISIFVTLKATQKAAHWLWMYPNTFHHRPPPPCSSLLPVMNHPWSERRWSKRRGSRLISWTLTGRGWADKKVDFYFCSSDFKITLLLTTGYNLLFSLVQKEACLHPPLRLRLTPNFHNYIQFD